MKQYKIHKAEFSKYKVATAEVQIDQDKALREMSIILANYDENNPIPDLCCENIKDKLDFLSDIDPLDYEATPCNKGLVRLVTDLDELCDQCGHDAAVSAEAVLQLQKQYEKLLAQYQAGEITDETINQITNVISEKISEVFETNCDNIKQSDVESTLGYYGFSTNFNKELLWQN